MKRHSIEVSCVIILISVFAFGIVTTNVKTYIIEKDPIESQKNKENNETLEVEVDTFSIPRTSTTDESIVDNSTRKVTDNTIYGTFGRLYVSSYNVALYDYNVNIESDSTLQAIVDNQDSAAYYLNNNKLIIADHNYQGFSILLNLKEGDTSYIKFDDESIIKYRLIKKSKGVNTGPDLIDDDGISFFDMDSDIIMYTCYEEGIMATLWVLA